MAEMISGVPLFRGRDNNDQLNQILRILGTPDEATLRRIAAESPEIQLRPFPRMNRIPWASLYPKAHPLALDLLDKLLQFDPARRIDCTTALHHPYFGSSAVQQTSTQPQQQQQQPSQAQSFAQPQKVYQ
ncbi:negative regulator of the PHO system [Microbotryomycetes sp. JL221]|nr:negative regulator of the PHO system [Microbotryomycetes sp. JL221]